MSPSLADLRPGDIMFGRIENSLPSFLPKALRFMPGTLPVALGQRLLAATSEEEKHIHHVGVVVEAEVAPPYYSRPRLVQAMPGGAEEIELRHEKHWNTNYCFVRPAYLNSAVSAAWVAREAQKYVGTPYSLLDYLAIAGLHAGVRNGPVRRYVRTSKHMICSQLADQAMADAGFHVFHDGRLPQDVMPVELYRALLAMPGVKVIIPRGEGVAA